MKKNISFLVMAVSLGLSFSSRASECQKAENFVRSLVLQEKELKLQNDIEVFKDKFAELDQIDKRKTYLFIAIFNEYLGHKLQYGWISGQRNTKRSELLALVAHYEKKCPKGMMVEYRKLVKYFDKSIGSDLVKLRDLNSKLLTTFEKELQVQPIISKL